jgi:hypothetical protein
MNSHLHVGIGALIKFVRYKMLECRYVQRSYVYTEVVMQHRCTLELDRMRCPSGVELLFWDSECPGRSAYTHQWILYCARLARFELALYAHLGSLTVSEDSLQLHTE